MRCTKKILLFAGTTLGMVALAPLAATGFSDVSSSTPYGEAIRTLQERGVIEGYQDGTFKPGSTINRAEFLKIILEGRTGESADAAYTGKNCFPDVKEEWFAPYVCTAKEEGIIGGYPDGTFKPGQPINFVEASKIIALAFGQDVEPIGTQWYEQYVRALEASRAIPPSVDRFERRIQRGEMVEMLWRLTDGHTDLASKGFLNMKYPDVGVDLSADTVQRATSCADLRAFVTEAGTNSPMMYDAIMAPAMESDGAPPRAMQKEQSTTAGDADYSRTNVQVQGVDEADIVKTDGTYLYVVRNNEVKIVRAVPADAMQVVGTITFDSPSFSPSEIYVDGDTLVALGSTYGGGYRWGVMEKMMPEIWPPSSQRSRTQVKIYDISNRSAPRETRTISLDGSQVSSRRIGDKLYLVLNQGLYDFVRPMPAGAVQEQDILPTYSDSATGTEDAPVARCGDVAILPHVPSPQYLIVAVIPTDDANAKIQIETVIGNGDNIYASLKNLYVANTRYRYVWRAGGSQSNEQTNLYRFALTDDGIELKAEGSVPGRILNQFSMDEHAGTFRIATTKGTLWDSSSPATNNLYVLNLDLQRLGAIEGIAPGEQIYSTRFMGNRAYMVTFRNTDPLFVIDTSDARNPVILGKLKIPGYSDYLHPYDDNHILGFGKDAVANAYDENFAWYQGMKVALFDVSDVENPKEKFQIAIGDRGTDSPLLQNHKALLFDKERNLLTFPVRINQLTDAQRKNNDGSAYGEPVFQGAQVYKITLAKGFELLGQITHYTSNDYLKAGSYFYGKDIERIVRIGTSLLTISTDGVQSHSESTVTKQGGLRYEAPFTDSGDCPAADDASAFYISRDPATCRVSDFGCSEGMVPFDGECGCGCKSE
ncbi:MAG: beta-propeller domain-containing protein [Candidatus Peribacteraceae bacterium]|nr:beta-propeller domain-containing protein [Candidatus Peribacteraceae bacterium]